MMHSDTSSGCARSPRVRHRAAKLIASIAATPIVVTLALTSAGASAQASETAPAPLPCSATVTNQHPLDGSSVGIQISTSKSARITVALHFRGKTHRTTARANRNGKDTIWWPVGGARPGYKVMVDVTVIHYARHGSCSTWFTPRKIHHHRRGGGGGGAWCTATASVYYAPYDWNNVYVNSNQPYTDATATGDGYSWSYETNANGYAVIYLNGPPPGTAVTVTVGAATCYTSIP
jgi:hypothetical protein